MRPGRSLAPVQEPGAVRELAPVQGYVSALKNKHNTFFFNSTQILSIYHPVDLFLRIFFNPLAHYSYTSLFFILVIFVSLIVRLKDCNLNI